MQVHNLGITAECAIGGHFSGEEYPLPHILIPVIQRRPSPCVLPTHDSVELFPTVMDTLQMEIPHPQSSLS